MRHFVNDTGLFECYVPSIWKYRLIDNKVHTFQNYELWKSETFQVSLRKLTTEEIQRIEFNRKAFLVIKVGKNICYCHPDSISDKFTTKVWSSIIDDYIVLFTFTFDPKILSGKNLNEELNIIYEVISSFRVVSEDNRELNLNFYRFTLFLKGTSASLAVLNKAIGNKAFIEVTCVLANLIDALLRISIVLKEQIINRNAIVEKEWIYQGLNDKKKSEKEIYKKALELEIIDTEIHSNLYKLYDDRNRVVHRFIISEITIAEIEDIAFEYSQIYQKIEVIVNNLESEQIKLGVGMTTSIKDGHFKKTPFVEYIKDKIGKINYFKNSRVGKGEFHPKTSHGTVLDSLPSHGSSNSRNHLRLTG